MADDYSKREYQRRKAAQIAEREVRRAKTFPKGHPPSTRTQHVLKNMAWPNPVTPEFVAGFTAGQLLDEPNFGRKCLPEVVEWLEGFGLKLRHDEGEDEKTKLIEQRERAELARLKAKYEQ